MSADKPETRKSMTVNSGGGRGPYPNRPQYLSVEAIDMDQDGNVMVRIRTDVDQTLMTSRWRLWSVTPLARHTPPLQRKAVVSAHAHSKCASVRTVGVQVPPRTRSCSTRATFDVPVVECL